MGVPTRIIKRGMFGKPTLQWLKNNGTESNGRATWTKEWRRYGQWTAKLSPGIQTDDDYGAVSFSVNNMPIENLQSIKYVYRMGATEVVAPNVTIHVYDPNDVDNRADITFTHSYTDLPKSSGWRKFHVTPDLDGFFYYGNNIPSTTGLTSSDGTAGTIYTLAQYQADVVFSTYVIDKISVEYGWYSTGYLSPAHICLININGEDMLLEPSVEEQLSITQDELAKAQRTIPTWTFGEAFLRHSVAGEGTWSRWHHQKGAHGWTAKLYGGVQTSYNDWAIVCVPANEVPLTELASALWTWNNTEEEAQGVNMIIYIHDPTDNDKRAEMTQLADHSSLEKAAGWLAHELSTSTDYFYWYGKGGSGDLTEGTPNYYGLDDFQADATFSSWTIYRIDFMWGGATGSEEYKDVWVADIKINGQVIPIKPDSSGTGRIGRKFYTGSAGISTGNGKLAPKTPYRLLSISMHLDGQQTSASSFVVSLLSEQGTNFDPAILTDDMDVPAGKVSLYAPFGQGYEFGMDDELDLVYTNGGTKTYGLTYTYEVL